MQQTDITTAGRVINLGVTGQGDLARTIADSHPGNAESYAASNCDANMDSSLRGKVIFWLGSSVTYGFGAKGEAVPDFLAYRDGVISYKSAISGTTLAAVPYGEESDNPWQARVARGMPAETCRVLSELSYVVRLGDFPEDARPDLFVLQLSTNDSQFPMRQLGEVAQGFDAANFDLSTTYGAMQYILATVCQRWHCPVLLYASPLLETESYLRMVETSKTLSEKWDAHLIDMSGDADFNNLGKAHMDEWMVDIVHPTRRGYLEWWTPAFESAIENIAQSAPSGF